MWTSPLCTLKTHGRRPIGKKIVGESGRGTLLLSRIAETVYESPRQAISEELGQSITLDVIETLHIFK